MRLRVEITKQLPVKHIKHTQKQILKQERYILEELVIMVRQLRMLEIEMKNII